MKVVKRIVINKCVCVFKGGVFSVVKWIVIVIKWVIVENKVLNFCVNVIGIEGVVF